MILRRDLHSVYKSLQNIQKTSWAEAAGYSSYAGLVQYLKSNPDSSPYPRIINALKVTIGQDEFNNLFKGSNSNLNTKENHDNRKITFDISLALSDDLTALNHAIEVLTKLTAMIQAKKAYKESLTAQ